MAYAAIEIEGGLFPADLLDRIAAGEGAGQAAKEFGLDGRRLSDETQAAFSDVRSYWDAFQRRREHSRESLTSLTRESWMIPALERLGFDLVYQRAGLAVGAESYQISHLAGDDPSAPPLHVVAIDQDLGKKEGARRSPHALVQEYLNRSDALWGIVTNGERLRLLRDSNRLSRPTYLEFDLRGMIEANLYSEFVLLYRLLHRTRFPRSAGAAASCILERLYQEGLDEGGRVRKHLRDGVEQALEILGNAFLSHPESGDLRAAFERGHLDAARYYRQLLRLVYRLLFLFVAEERRLIFPPDSTTTDLHEIYSRYYSANRLRDRCERPYGGDRFGDLWRGLVRTFELLRDDETARMLGLTALDGELFGPSACRDLETAHCHNRDLLRAIFHLSTFKDEKVRRRVNYAGLDVEELGSVYESLLEYRPAVRLDDPRPFQLVAGSDRKTTGSYYTPPELVRELIESALVPVLNEQLAAAKTREEQERAILSLKVCDPASGSGHFLLAAARRLGRELARVRTGEAEPAPDAYRLAVRDVIRSCIYAVDKNPLAVDLCKVALWIEGHHAGLPLSFLDYHIKHGDSLVGVFDLAVLRQGIPDDAYKSVTGDDKKFAIHVRKLNTTRSLDYADGFPDLDGEFAREFGALALLDERNANDVRAKEQIYAQLRDPETVWWTWRRACNLWTAAFFAPLVEDAPRRFSGSLAPLTEDVHRALTQPKSLDAEVGGRADALADRLAFFHWPLEFPEVFEAGGFDVVLGNPPWERIKLQEQEFFAARDPAIATASNKAARQRLIDRLPESDPALARAFADAKHDAEAASTFLRASGRFPRTGRGDINTYSVFAEQTARMAGHRGRGGVLVPTGIATDDTNKHFFRWLVEHGRLVSLFDFENREGLFPAVDSRMKFSLLTVSGAERPAAPFEAAFFLLQPAELRDPESRFTLSADDIALLNPNTRTCPIFRSARDAEITRALYRAAPVLINEATGENPWGVTFKRMLDMSNDSHLFRTRAELEGDGAILGPDGRFRRGDEVWERLYQGMMFQNYDHRAADIVHSATAAQRQNQPIDISTEEHNDSSRLAIPMYWVHEQDIAARLVDYCREWFVAFANVTSPTNMTTVKLTILPRTAAGHSLQLILPKDTVSASRVAALAANLNCLAFDWVTRQKIGGVNLSYFIVKQLPVLPPETYTLDLLDEIVTRVLELVYTAHDLVPFARDCGCDGPPFDWDEERRAQLRAELDGIYAHLYGLNRDDFAYILGTFPVLEKNERKAFGEYRTKRLCLDAYDRFTDLSGEAAAAVRHVFVLPEAPARPEPVAGLMAAEPPPYPYDARADETPSVTGHDRYRQAAVVAWLANQSAGDPTFGRTKLAKELYFLQEHLGVDLNLEFVREAAGPLDPKLYPVEGLAQKQSWLTVTKQRRIVRYRPGRKAAEADGVALRFLSDRLADVEALVTFFRPFDWLTIEQWATVHQVWRQRREQGQPLTKSAILDEVLAWKPSRSGFDRRSIAQVIDAMIEHGFVALPDHQPRT